MSNLTTYQEEDKYVIITLNNGKVNAISSDVINELNIYLDKAEALKKIVILTGTTGMFSGGYDLKTMTNSPKDALALVTLGSTLALRMLSFPMPIIVAATGHSLAKGAFLLLCADYRIGTEGDYKIGLNEVAIGMTMHNAGIAIAKARLAPVFFERSVNNAEVYNPSDAVNAGFLDTVVTPEATLPTAIKVAEMFSGLNKKAHAQTKLKLRKPYLEALKKAIALDKTELFKS